MKKTAKKKETNGSDIFSTLKIETGIPVFRTRGSSSAAAELMRKMQVGQSIKFPNTIVRTFKAAYSSLKRNEGKQYTFRTLDKFNSRVWRLEDGKVLARRTKKAQA